MWVIKLGGSLLASAEGMQALRAWLTLIVQQADGQVIIVPGGGLFADAVRTAQQQSGCDDVTAHRLALLAMDQYGMLLAGLAPSLVTAQSELEIAERSWQHRPMVWLPSRMLLADRHIAASWDVTSDSLAAWLAAKLGASHLLLVKSVRPAGTRMRVEALVSIGLVDASFADYIQQPVAAPFFSTWLLGPQDHLLFSSGFVAAHLQQGALAVEASINVPEAI